MCLLVGITTAVNRSVRSGAGGAVLGPVFRRLVPLFSGCAAQGPPPHTAKDPISLASRAVSRNPGMFLVPQISSTVTPNAVLVAYVP